VGNYPIKDRQEAKDDLFLLPGRLASHSYRGRDSCPGDDGPATNYGGHPDLWSRMI